MLLNFNLPYWLNCWALLISHGQCALPNSLSSAPLNLVQLNILTSYLEKQPMGAYLSAPPEISNGWSHFVPLQHGEKNLSCLPCACQLACREPEVPPIPFTQQLAHGIFTDISRTNWGTGLGTSSTPKLRNLRLEDYYIECRQPSVVY